MSPLVGPVGPCGVIEGGALGPLLVGGRHGPFELFEAPRALVGPRVTPRFGP